MNARGKAIDNTYLSLDQAEERGFLHRDYIAHCLRWSHVVRYLYRSKTYLTAKILDVGCGEEVPLLKLLHSSRLGPTQGYYVGVDAKKFTPPEKKVNFEAHVLPGILFPAMTLPHQEFNVVTCFEVVEHCEPVQSLEILKGIRHVLEISGGTGFLSTPCYDPSVGAADNHVNEMSYQAMKFMLLKAGLVWINHWGTFASQKNYKGLMDDHEKVVFDRLSEYYDSNMVSCIFAPLYPSASRNVLWQVKAGEVYQDPVGFVGIEDGLNSSSTLWPDFVRGLV